MELPSEARKRFLKHAEKLDRLIHDLRNSPHWITGRHIAGRAGSYLQHLIAHLVHVDGRIAGAELALLGAFHRDVMSHVEEHEWIRDTVLSTPQFMESVPEFLIVAGRERNGRQLATAMLREIEELSTIIVSLDGNASEVEKRALDGHLANLRTFIDRLPEATH